MGYDSGSYGRKAFHVRPKDIVRFFEAAGRPDNWLPVPRIKGLPEGYAVDYVTSDPLRDCFVFILSHPAWPKPAEFVAPAEIESAEWEIVELDPGGFEAKHRKAADELDHVKWQLKTCRDDLARETAVLAAVREAHNKIARRPARYALRRLFGLDG